MQYCGFSTWRTSLFERILPESLSIARTDSSVPSAVALVSQTREPQMTGEDQALPGRGVFQATFCVSLHWSGSRVGVGVALVGRAAEAWPVVAAVGV